MSLGRLLLGAGLVLAVLGVLALLLERGGVKLGRLPGDVAYRNGNSTFYFPVVTCIILSVVLSLVSWLFSRR